MFVLPKPPVGLKTTVQNHILVAIKKIVIIDLNIGFLNTFFFHEFRMKYFKDIEILYKKFYIISKHCSISNINVNTVFTDMNNVESNTD